MTKSDRKGTSVRVKAAVLTVSCVCLFATLFCSPVELTRRVKAFETCAPIENPFQLVEQKFSNNAPPNDPNGFLLNPQWAWQVHCPAPIKDGVAQPTLDNYPDSIDQKQCADAEFSDCDGDGDQTSFDPVGFCPMCNLGRRRAGRKLGHVNWFTVTYTGDVCYHNTSFPDMDYTFSLRPKNGAGLTRWNHPSKPDRSGNPEDPEKLPLAIHVEFDSRETVNFFQSDTWKQFRAWANPCRWWDFRRPCDEDSAMKLISLRRAVVVGLMGLDSEHDIYSESHPVYAMAIEVDSDTRNNTWIVFARNTGTEGNCSSQDHPLIVNGELLRTIKLLIPPPADALTVNSVSANSTQFFSNNDSCPELSYYNNADYSEDNEGVLMTFNLPPCGENCPPLIEGEIHLNWDYQKRPVVPGIQAREVDKCLLQEKKEAQEERKKYSDPTPAQAVALLRLLSEERAALGGAMTRCATQANRPIPAAPVSAQQKTIQARIQPARRAEAGVKTDRVEKHFSKISNILFP